MKALIRTYGPPLFHCINDFGQGSLAALIPFFISNFNLTYAQAATIIFCNTIVASIAQPALGYIADRWRVPWFIPLGFTITLVSLSAISLATSYPMILILALLSGIGAALFHPEAALLVRRLQSHEIGNAMGRFAVGGSAGFALGPHIAGDVYFWGPYLLWVFALAALGYLKNTTTHSQETRTIGLPSVNSSLSSPLGPSSSPPSQSLFLFSILRSFMDLKKHLAWP